MREDTSPFSYASVSTFLYTPLIWGETKWTSSGFVYPEISIHSPRMGGDERTCRVEIENVVSIHSPRMRGRRYCAYRLARFYVFLYTPPRMREDVSTEGFPCRCHFYTLLSYEGRLIGFHPRSKLMISIHSPRMRGDLKIASYHAPPDFYTLPSYEGRHFCVFSSGVIISIHSPHIRGRRGCMASP